MGVSLGRISDLAIETIYRLIHHRPAAAAHDAAHAGMTASASSVVAPLHPHKKHATATMTGRLRLWLHDNLNAKARAFRRLVAAAHAGDADSQYRLGRIYLSGQGAPRYPLVAARWLAAAAAQDHIKACHVLSLIYSTGVKTDAALPDTDANGQQGLGGMLGSGRVVSLYPQGFDIMPDPECAFDYAKAAAQRGFAAAQGNLGLMYLRGIGCPQDYRRAARWARFAAVQHDAKGALALGTLNEHGLGIPVNLAEAARWYSVASDQGNDTASTALGLLLLDGRGVTQDIKMAQQLLAGPAARGDDIAKQGLARSRSRRRYTG